MTKKTMATPFELNDLLGSEMNEVLASAWAAIEDSQKKFPDKELILSIIRDKENRKSYTSALPKDVFLRELLPELARMSINHSALQQLREPAGPGAMWMCVSIGRELVTGRLRFVDERTGPIAGTGFSDEPMLDQELLRLSLAIWNARRSLAVRTAPADEDDIRLFKAVAKGQTPLPHSFGVRFCESWAEQGYPRLVTTHKFAAALMCTKVRPDDVADAHIPWTAFQVAVPNGLLIGPGAIEYGRIAILLHDGTALMAIYSQSGRAPWISMSMPTERLFAADDELDNEALLDEGTVRLTFLARRLVAGLLLTLDDSARLQGKPSASRAESDARDEPKHRVFICGRAINVDCRPAVSAFLRGGNGGLASVQVLVRGHYKRQVVGIGRSGRRVIWVEPYWRGPEDAPILARPYRIGSQ